MATLTLEDYTYSQKLRIYNSEGRENVGINDVTMADYTRYFDSLGSTLQTFYVDVTQPPEDLVTVCSFKNGASIKMNWYDYTPSSVPHGNYGAWVTMRLVDKNGVTPQGAYSSWYIEWRPEGQTPEHTPIYYYPPSFEYNFVLGDDHPYRASAGGCIVAYDSVPVIVLNKPDFHNNKLVWDKFTDWYTLYTFQGWDFEMLMNVLDPDSLPKKPDDDTSKPDEGDPDYDPDPDPVPFPDLPEEGDALSTGFISVYQPSSVELQTLATQLWSNDFITTFRKTYNDPIEAIVSLHSIPFQIVVGSRVNCMVGNYDSNITMLKVSAQYYTINCGTINVTENFGSALDYAPYTQCEIYLPFVGIRPLNIDDIMGKNLEVKYNIDILTGGGIAMIKCDQSVLYTFPCEVSQDIPYTMTSKMQLYTNVAQLVVSGVTAMAAPSAGTISAAASSAINVATGKQTGITRGGTLGGNIGVLGDFRPYLIIHKPIQSLAADYAHKNGYPSNITATLSNVTGYTEIESIHLDNIPCTDSERDEIERLLKEGVIL